MLWLLITCSRHAQQLTHLSHRRALLQGHAEYILEKLHGKEEKQVLQFLDATLPLDAWPKFREGLIGLTDVTRSHFDKLVAVGACTQIPQIIETLAQRGSTLTGTCLPRTCLLMVVLELCCELIAASCNE